MVDGVHTQPQVAPSTDLSKYRSPLCSWYIAVCACFKCILHLESSYARTGIQSHTECIDDILVCRKSLKSTPNSRISPMTCGIAIVVTAVVNIVTRCLFISAPSSSLMLRNRNVTLCLDLKQTIR